MILSLLTLRLPGEREIKFADFNTDIEAISILDAQPGHETNGQASPIARQSSRVSLQSTS